MKEVATPLAHIVNLSLSHGIFPNDMKLAKIVPILKNGNTKLFNNYRPVSILPDFSKILEKNSRPYVTDYYRVIWRRHAEAFAQPRDTTAA